MITGSNFAIVKVAFLAVDEQLLLLLLLHLLYPVLQSYSVQYVNVYFTSSCDPTTMALLVTDSQWFLCHLELIHNICDSYDGQCPCVNGIWLQPYLYPFIFVLYLPFWVICYKCFHVTCLVAMSKIPEIFLTISWSTCKVAPGGKRYGYSFFLFFFFSCGKPNMIELFCWKHYNKTKNLFWIQWQSYSFI